ncbi:hypothetical protein [Maribacter litoralis]|uniref:hypothetical protein n=1 Tax=Maribacter litoralis TaxID=2059726 RepID=UPI003F5CDDEA
MINSKSFTREWLDTFRAQKEHKGINVTILEKMVHAFSLLEHLKIAGLDFVFKGGTSLVLLLEEGKLNELLIGWLNYFSISKVTHIWETRKVILPHLDYKLYKWLKSKGRKAHKLLRQRPYRNLVNYKKPVRFRKICTLENACKSSMKNTIGKPCEGKLHARFEAGGTVT